MTTILGEASSGPGIRYLLPDVTGIFVLAGANVVSTDATAIVGNGVIHKVTVAGHVFGEDDGIALGDNNISDQFERVTVLAGASVSGGDDAIQITANQSYVTNYGTLSGAFGMTLWGTGTGETRVVNAGVITASAEALHFVGDETRVVINTGTIEGVLALYSLHNSIELITNRGLMIGNVRLGGNNDVFDDRGGTVLGLIDGGEGDDRFLPGLAGETIEGGSGNDTLDFRSTVGIKVVLDGSLVNTGTAAGDSYTGIERIYGSLIGGDTLIGSGASNALTGYGGADVLKGGGGADLLNGGVGKDSLTGGLGNDAFVFKTAAEGGDLIADFSNGTGNNDRFNINAADFGGGLVAGTVLLASQFQSRADNLAQDIDDRFVFRTSDATLWFDSNGNLAGGLSMVANLQAGAVVTNLDILLV